MTATDDLLSCPRCGTYAEVVLGNHIRCGNIYNCDCETRLGKEAWNRRAHLAQNAAPAPDAMPEQPIGRFLPDCMTNSGDPCKAFAELRAECERLRKDAARFAAWFGDNDDIRNTALMRVHHDGVNSDATIDEWRAAIDAAMAKP